jgi:hypothetical protein
MPGDRTHSQQNIQALPIAGAHLVRFHFCGNGKDSEATIEVRGAPKIIVPLEFAQMDLSFSGPVTVRTRGHGDTETTIDVVSTPDHPVIVADAAILFPGDEREWDEFRQRYAETGKISWCVTLRLRLAAE